MKPTQRLSPDAPSACKNDLIPRFVNASPPHAADALSTSPIPKDPRALAASYISKPTNLNRTPSESQKQAAAGTEGPPAKSSASSAVHWMGMVELQRFPSGCTQRHNYKENVQLVLESRVDDIYIHFQNSNTTVHPELRNFRSMVTVLQLKDAGIICATEDTKEKVWTAFFLNQACESAKEFRRIIMDLFQKPGSLE